MSVSKVTVVMTAYAPLPPDPRAPIRMGYARSVLDSLRDYLLWERDIEYLISDDSAQGSLPADFYFDLAGTLTKTSYMNHNRKGIGGSLNGALGPGGVSTPMWLYITDDWVLTEYLDLTGPIALIAQCGYDYVRLGPIHPNLECTVKFQAGIGWWLHLHQEAGGFAFATRPFLASRRFYETIGRFIEKQDSYVTEEDYAKRVAASGEVRLAQWGGITLHGPWEHIGEIEVGRDTSFH